LAVHKAKCGDVIHKAQSHKWPLIIDSPLNFNESYLEDHSALNTVDLYT